MSTVFYSWQSDLPNPTNRGFLGDVLERAVKAIRADGSLALDPRVDMDVQGVPGAPDIAAAIFGKIDRCAVFVADVSLVHGEDVARRCPNPNVLLELGYALHAVGPSRVVLLLNRRFGGPELLPFDLKQRSVVVYDLGEGEDKTAARQQLIDRLVRQVGASLRAYLEASPPAPVVDTLAAVIALVENAKPTRAARVLGEMRSIARALNDIAKAAPGHDDSAYASGFEQTVPHVECVARLSDVVAAADDSESARKLFQGFESVLMGYYPPRSASSYRRTDFDLMRVVGRELFLTFVAALLRHERWEMLATVLSQSLYIENPGWDATSAGHLSWHWLQNAPEQAREARLAQVRSRHLRGALAGVVPWTDLVAADLFLAIHSPNRMDGEPCWFPRALSDASKALPRFLLEVRDPHRAATIGRAIGVDGYDAFKKRVDEALAAAAKVDPMSPSGFHVNDLRVLLKRNVWQD